MLRRTRKIDVMRIHLSISLKGLMKSERVRVTLQLLNMERTHYAHPGLGREVLTGGLKS
jgi:hypothetical protein